MDLSDVFVHDNTDVVVLMTMHKSQDGVAGYASCGKYDDSNRCIVGNFNWCPDQVDVTNTLDTNVIQYERSTFLHEVMHVLGCCSGDQFIDENGAQRGSGKPSLELRKARASAAPRCSIIVLRIDSSSKGKSQATTRRAWPGTRSMALRNPENGPWLKPLSTNVSEDPSPSPSRCCPSRIERKTSLQKGRMHSAVTSHCGLPWNG